MHPHLGYRTVSHNASHLKVKGYVRKAIWNGGGAFLIFQDGEKQRIVAKTVADAVETLVDLNQDIPVETLEVLRIPKKTGAVGLVLVNDEIKGYYRRVGVFSTLEVEDKAALLGWIKSSRNDVIFLV